jgi:hypothetical protein
MDLGSAKESWVCPVCHISAVGAKAPTCPNCGNQMLPATKV